MACKPIPLSQNIDGDKFESPLPHTKKPAFKAGFDVLKWGGDYMGTKKYALYREPKIVTTGKKWYIEYYYRIPEDLRPQYDNKRWRRFKIYKDINIHRTPEYCAWLRNIVEKGLEGGYNPFNDDKELLTDTEPKKEWTIQQASLYFLQKWEGRGLSEQSLVKYKRSVNRFIDWLTLKNLQHKKVEAITNDHVERYLEENKSDLGWSNSTYNGERGFISTLFNFLTDKNIVSKKIVAGDKLKTKSKKHRYYDDKTFKHLKKVLIENDPYLYFAFQVVYYLCIRSEEELKHFKVGNIFPDRGQVFITVGKTGERYIPLPKEMLEVFKKRKILSYPKDYYVFSVAAKNKFVADGVPGPEPFGKGFFSKRFAKIRKLAGLTSDSTLYGMKHTRIIHLKTDGAKDADIMQLTGHTSYEAYSIYLRDLGMTSNGAELQRLTRKI